jgi:chromosome segregation ATPase
MTRDHWDAIIKQLPKKSRDALKRVLRSYAYAFEKHPGAHIGPQYVYDAWKELHRQAVEKALDSEANDLFALDASMGTVAQYMDWASAYQLSAKTETASSYAGAAADQEPAIQQALDSLKTGIDRVGGLIVEQKSRVEAEQKERFQSVLDGQLAAANEIARQAEADKAAYRQVAVERQQLSEQIEALRDHIVAVDAERAAAVAQVKATTHAHEIDHARLTAAEGQLATMQKSEAVLSKEVSRLQDECKGVAAHAERSAQLNTEIVVLRGRAANLENEVRRLESIIIATEKHYEHERTAVRNAHDQALAEERRCSADREAQLLAMIASLAREGNDKGNR